MEQSTGSALDPLAVLGLLRWYWLQTTLLLALGFGAGLLSMVLSPPTYQARALLELQTMPSADAGKAGADSQQEINLQTTIHLLRREEFIHQVVQEIEIEKIPASPASSDLIGKIRTRYVRSQRDPDEMREEALNWAIATFEIRPIYGTHLMEVVCDSTHPLVAAGFVNTLAANYAEETLSQGFDQTRAVYAVLEKQVEESKRQLHEAEDRLSAFTTRSRGEFISAGAPSLTSSKLDRLKAELAENQAERIRSQALVELIEGGNLEAATDNDSVEAYQAKIADLEAQIARLGTKYTAKHSSIVKLEAEKKEIQAALNKAVRESAKSVHLAHESALRQERLLRQTYARERSRLDSESQPQAEYESLASEVEMLRQIYVSTRSRASEFAVLNSAPRSTLRLIDAASPPVAPYKPRPAINLGLGLILGIGGAFGLAVIRHSVGSSRQLPLLRSVLDVPQLGMIPAMETERTTPKWKRGMRLIESGEARGAHWLDCWSRPESFVAESFRNTVVSLLHNEKESGRAQRILITSAVAGEGKSTVVSNLGIGLAESGRRVLLVDADFRKPMLHQLFCVPRAPGLSEYLAGESEGDPLPLYVSPRGAGRQQVAVLAAGRTHNNTSLTLQSNRLTACLDSFESQFDYILIDSPPMLFTADARILSSVVDGVLLVVRSGVSEYDAIQEAYSWLQQDDVRVIGCVLNDWRPPGGRRYYYERSA